ncbi:MAG TPA: PadR family transcriptional regulator [Actinomycetes bacterium]
MSTPELNPVSYVVLGLVNRDGPSTPYELKTAVGRGIAYFWQFPHSQIYAESERLARLGLLVEERELTGRRRRTYRITAEGRQALQAWLARPTAEPTQLRSLALLQLYFGWFSTPDDVAALARVQATFLRERAALFRQTAQVLEARKDRRWQQAVAEVASGAEQAMAEAWEQIEQRALAQRDRPAAAGER